MHNHISIHEKTKHYSFIPPVTQLRGIRNWQTTMALGFLVWLALFIVERVGKIPEHPPISIEWLLVAVNMLIGVLLVHGTCESLIAGSQGLASIYRWDTFIAGTITEILTLLPELAIIFFLVKVNPYLTFLVTAAAIYNNALAFSVYSFFLPKDLRGRYLMPEPITKAGTEVLIAGSGMALVIGFVMIVFGHNGKGAVLREIDLIFIGAALLVVFASYLHTLMRYYSKAKEEYPTEKESVTFSMSLPKAITLLFFGVLGAWVGGEAVSKVGDTLVNVLNIPLIPTAILIALFGAFDEYVVIIQSHKQKMMGIALSNVFGGITQIMFLVMPFTLIAIGVSGLLGIVEGSLPINFATTLVIVLLFPVLFVLFEYLEEDHTLNNLDAAGMLAIFVLILYALLFMSGV